LAFSAPLWALAFLEVDLTELRLAIIILVSRVIMEITIRSSMRVNPHTKFAANLLFFCFFEKMEILLLNLPLFIFKTLNKLLKNIYKLGARANPQN